MAQLELSTTREREFITIDGKDYALQPWDDLDLHDSLAAIRVMKLLTPERIDKVTPEQIKKLNSTVEKLVKWLLPDLPEDVLGKLNFAMRAAIAGAAVKSSGNFMKTEEDKKEEETEI
jgi:hypothetical protein